MSARDGRRAILPSGLSAQELIEIGRALEKADQNAKRLDRLEDELRGRDQHSRALVLGWWQVVVGGLFVIAGSCGSAALILFVPR
jgi:hypothetical protein